MTLIAILLLVAAAGYGISRWLRLPVIPLLLFAGIGLSMTGVMGADQSGLTVNAVELGLAFLVFSAGIELNPARFGQQLKGVLWVGLVQFAIVGLMGFAAAMLLDFNRNTSIYLAIALSTSSTLVVVNYLKQTHQMFESFGRLVIGVLLLQDLLMILLIVVLARLPGGGWEVAQGLAGVLALTGVAAGFQRWVLPFLLTRIKPDEETLLLAVLALLFAFIGLSVWLGLPPVAGAFLAGFSLSNFPVNGVCRGLLGSLSDFFQAIFFTALGGLVLAPDLYMIGKSLVLVLVVLLVTPPLVTLLAERAGLNSRAALESGLLLAQTSEFALVLGLAGSVLGQIDRHALSIITLVSVITMTLTPFVATDRVNRFLLRFHPLRRRLKEEPAHHDHALMLGFGAAGMWVLKPLRQAGYDVVVVEDDPAVIDQLQKTGIPCLRGDGADEKILSKAGANGARLILVSLPRAPDAEKILHHVRPGIPVLVRVFEESDAHRIRKMGGIPILNAEAAVETFMEWFAKTQPKPAGGS